MSFALFLLSLNLAQPAVCSDDAVTSSIRACIDTCHFYNDTPGYQLSACIAKCRAKTR